LSCILSFCRFSSSAYTNSYRQKNALHGKQLTVMTRDSEHLRDIIQSIDPDNPIGRAGPLTQASRLQTLLDAREQHRKNTIAFDKQVIEKRKVGLHPRWNRHRRFLGWENEPMGQIPPKRMPWWEDKLKDYGTPYRAANPNTF
jgi:hypothetical protein